MTIQIFYVGECFSLYSLPPKLTHLNIHSSWVVHWSSSPSRIVYLHSYFHIVINVAPPSPYSLSSTFPQPDHGHIGMHTLSRNMPRPGSQSPPLPPPPPPEESEHSDFGRPRSTATGQGGVGSMQPIVPDDQNLPGWVPKNYIEKGEKEIVFIY